MHDHTVHFIKMCVFESLKVVCFKNAASDVRSLILPKATVPENSLKAVKIRNRLLKTARIWSKHFQINQDCKLQQ